MTFDSREACGSDHLRCGTAAGSTLAVLAVVAAALAFRADTL
jgi:hypothetical protein